MTPLPVIPNIKPVRSVDLTPSAVEQRVSAGAGDSVISVIKHKQCRYSAKSVNTWKRNITGYVYAFEIELFQNVTINLFLMSGIYYFTFVHIIIFLEIK